MRRQVVRVANLVAVSGRLRTRKYDFECGNETVNVIVVDRQCEHFEHFNGQCWSK
jgi:single-stranded DNA-binding protein